MVAAGLDLAAVLALSLVVFVVVGGGGVYTAAGIRVSLTTTTNPLIV
jgi:hypothetical protein